MKARHFRVPGFFPYSFNPLYEILKVAMWQCGKQKPLKAISGKVLPRSVD
jgi:hypothetical protein